MTEIKTPTRLILGTPPPVPASPPATPPLSSYSCSSQEPSTTVTYPTSTRTPPSTATYSPSTRTPSSTVTYSPSTKTPPSSTVTVTSTPPPLAASSTQTPSPSLVGNWTQTPPMSTSSSSPPPPRVVQMATTPPRYQMVTPPRVRAARPPSLPPATTVIVQPSHVMNDSEWMNAQVVEPEENIFPEPTPVEPPTLPPRGQTHQASLRTWQPDQSKRVLVEEDLTEWGTGSKCCFSFLMFLVQVLLFGALALVFFWVFHFRGGVAWHDDIGREFNLHPLLMVSGFVFLLGQAILVYRGLRCCRKIYNKLVHTVLHLLVMPAAAIAAVAVFDFHNLSVPPIPDLYSLHSWMGLATLGLFALQFLLGFFTFLVLLCCENATARFRASMLPLHVHFGLVTFLLAIATCLTGLTEKAIFTLREDYSRGSNEGRVMNALGIVLIALAILLTYIVRSDRYRRLTTVVLDERL